MANHESPAQSCSSTDYSTMKHRKTIQLPAYEGVYFKFSADPDAELPWFTNLSVTAYRGIPPVEVAIKQKIKPRTYLDSLMSDLTSYSIRRGAMEGAFDGAGDEVETTPGSKDELSSEEDEADGSDDDEDESENFDESPENYCEQEEDDFGSDEEDTDSKSERLGDVYGRLMRRGEIRSDFWRDMEEPSQDTAALGFDLFDRYGCLREEYITGMKKGSAIWSHEVDTGDLLQIETVNVLMTSRRQGFASTMLQVLLEEAQKMDKWFRFALSWPTFLNRNAPRDLPEESFKSMRDEGEEVAIKVFRKAGFRRVGSSAWFAFAVMTDHPSHQLSAEADCSEAGGASELQKFGDLLERTRTKQLLGGLTLVVSDRFKGYSDEDVQKLLSLRGIINPSIAVIAQTKYGCTCGECIKGYLSPRMATQIKNQSELNFDMEEDGEMIWCFSDDVDSIMAPSSFKYLPPHVRPYMKSNKSNREGHRQMYTHILTVIAAKRAPTIPNILRAVENASEWPPHTKNFLGRADVAGVEAILRGLFDDLKGRDPKVRGFIDIIAYRKNFPKSTEGGKYAGMGDILLEEAQLEMSLLEDLPRCRNDGEFRFVLGMLLNKIVGTSMEEYWG